MLKLNWKSYALYQMVVSDAFGGPLTSQTTPISTFCVVFRIFHRGPSGWT